MPRHLEEPKQLYEISIAPNDNLMNRIQQQIQTKRNFLLQKRATLENNFKQNHFLEGIKNDYQNYHGYISKQKQDQVQAMELLNQYFGDLIVSGKMTNKDVLNTKKEQSQILSEMNTIKQDLDEIIK